MNFQSILAVTDLSAEETRTVNRAALIAAHHQVLLKIMYAPPAFPGPRETHVARDIAKLAMDIHTRFGVLVKLVADTSGHLQTVAKEARWVDLLVLGYQREGSMTAFFHGQPVERLLRVVPCPILVTRLEAHRRYRRILVAIDFTPESMRLVNVARKLDGTADVELFHALSTMHAGKLRYADVSKEAIRSYRRDRVQDARERMMGLARPSAARRGTLVSGAQGHAALLAAVQQRTANAELLVVGKHRSSAFSDFLIGSVAQRVLKWSAGDVMMVPHGLRIAPRVLPLGNADPPSVQGHGVMVPIDRQSA